MAKVFMSYRRSDSAAVSGRIYDRLIARFGKENIFKDVDDIPAGVRFADYIQDSLRQCTVELVIIGPTWQDAKADDGTRRLDDPRDWVRQEIETGLAQGLTVIPILVEGMNMPPKAILPESLQALSQINALAVRNDPDFSRDMDRLLSVLTGALVVQPHNPPQPAAKVKEAIVGQWQEVATPTSDTLHSVAMVSAGNGWAVTHGIAALHYAMGQWQEVRSPSVFL